MSACSEWQRSGAAYIADNSWFDLDTVKLAPLRSKTRGYAGVFEALQAKPEDIRNFKVNFKAKPGDIRNLKTKPGDIRNFRGQTRGYPHLTPFKMRSIGLSLLRLVR